MLCVLLFSCRPSEAAYLIHANSFQRNTFAAFKDCAWVATIPASYNKTKLLYKWPVPKKMEWMVRLTKALHELVPTLQSDLGDPKTKFNTALQNFYKQRVLVDAAKLKGVVAIDTKAERFYCMRTIRAHHAEVWAEKAEECKRLGLPLPFNPLQHTTPKTTFKNYVPPQERAPATLSAEARQN